MSTLRPSQSLRCTRFRHRVSPFTLTGTLWLSLAITAASACGVSGQVVPPKETLVVNITSASYLDSDGALVLRAVASNSTTRDVVITAAMVVHVAMELNGNVSLGYKKTGKIPPFKDVIVGAGKSAILEITSEVDLEDFYKDNLEATHVVGSDRQNAREGRLFVEIRTVDGLGKTHQNFFRIGTVGVYKENGKYVRPYVITQTKPLDALQDSDFAAQIADGFSDK
jgi:hypothetical protein